MQNLTKAQVIALFIGAASATTLDNLNALSSADTADISGDDKQTLQVAANGLACNANGTCAAEGQKCASIQDGAAQGSGVCVAEWMCGALGRTGGVDFSVNCWTAVADGETAAAPALVDATANLAAIEGLITKTTANFNISFNAQWNDLIIPATELYQTGHWYKAIAGNTNTDVGKWWWQKKPSDNRCFLDLQCDADKCCSQYPDVNNRRCELKTAVNNAITIGPVTITPTCPTVPADTTPENAQDDIAKTALSKANEELDAWRDSVLADAKKAAGYDTEQCDQACKDKFDAEAKADKDAYDKFTTELMTLISFEDKDKCDLTCKTVFQSDLLAWEKKTYETCKADAKSIQCREAQAIKKDTETARGNTYYSGTPEERTAADAARKEADEALEATLTAAWIKNNKPAAGEEGSDCKADNDGDDLVGAVLGADDYSCQNELHCCGDATPKQGAFVNAKLEKICLKKDSLAYTDGLNREYTFKCLESAIKLASTAATAVLAAYYM